MTRPTTALVARTVTGGWWLDVKVLVATGLVGGLLVGGRRLRWLVLWWREPGTLAAATVAAWWAWWPALVVVASATAWYLLAPQGRRFHALEVERRDRLRVARHWRRSKDWPVRWSHKATPWAIDDHGGRVPRPIPGSHVLIGGMTGSGKSVAVHGLIACLAENRWVHFVGIDLKGGVEFVRWAPRFDVMARTRDDAVAALTAVEAWLERRLAAMYAEELDDVGEPSQTWPHVVIVVDEVASLLRSPTNQKKLLRLMTDGVERGRAAGLWFANATQSPKADVLPTQFRDQHGTSAVGKTRTRTMANVIAGDGVFGEHAAQEWGDDAPWTLDVSAPDYRDSGRFILVDGTARRVRFVRRSKEEIARLVAQTSWIAERPLVTVGAAAPVDEVALAFDELALDDEDDLVDAATTVPSVEWTRDELVVEARRRGHKPRARATKPELLDLLEQPL